MRRPSRSPRRRSPSPGRHARARASGAVALTAALGAFGVAAHGAPKKGAGTSSSANAAASSAAIREIRSELAPDLAGVHPEYAACASTISLSDLDPEGLVRTVRQRCLNLRVPPTATPTEITVDDVLVAICVRDRRAIETRQCGMKLQAVVVGDGGAPNAVSLSPQGELLLVLRASKLDAQLGLENGTPFSLNVTTQTATPTGLDVRSARSPLVFRRPMQPYGQGRWVWLPMPMLTTDFSRSAAGYRLGITPIAVAVGTRFNPWSSRTYLGASLFGAWNLLVPNDTQTLTNGTQVRVNYEAVGGGVLFDLSGWIGVGVGVGHTFTTDSRTDLRTWFYVGPRVLKLFGDL